jgi:type I restriction enzyme S subunit
VQQIGSGVYDLAEEIVEATRFERLSKHHVRPGDLVVAGLVVPLVRCCEVPSDIVPALVKADCYRFSVHPQISARFASRYLNSTTAQEFASAHHHDMTLTRIGLGNFRRIPFPVPPLAEQRRIVAKIDELMQLCDLLEAQLAAIRDEGGRLLEAILHEA